MALTNLPAAIFFSLGALILCWWVESREDDKLLGASLLWAFAVLTRSDALPFIVVTLGVIVLALVRRPKEALRVGLICGLPPVIVYVVWQLYVSQVLGFQSGSRFVLEQLIDLDWLIKVLLAQIKNLFNPMVFGVSGVL